MIDIADLKFQYPGGEFELVIDELAVSEHSSTAIIGPSGCGKTTLLQLIAGVIMPDRGTITTAGKQVTSLSDSARRDFRIQHIGMIFQEFELLDYLNVVDNILLPYRISPALQLTTEVRERALTLATDVGIGDKAKRYARHLSQGERQRVAICRALLTSPALVIADEPTGNLDPTNTDKVLEIVFDYVATNQATLVAVTHERHLVDRFDHCVDFTAFRKDRKEVANA